MCYYGAHHINISEYRIACYCYHPVKFLNSAVIFFKSAREHACMSVCVYLDVRVLFCTCIHVLRLELNK